MGRLGISYAAVAQAAAELQGRQKNPTVDAVRQCLGTGSKSTIARYLNEWKAHQGLHLETTALPGELLSLVNGLWQRLQAQADERIDQMEHNYGVELSAIAQQYQAAEQRNQDQHREIQQLAIKLQQYTQENQILQKSLTQEQINNARLNERTEADHQYAQAQGAEIERLHHLLGHIQTNLEHYQAATQRLREEHELLLSKQHQEYERRAYENQQNILAKEQKILNLQGLLEQANSGSNK